MKIQNKNIIKISDEYGVEQEVIGFDESTCSDECSVVSVEQVECVFERVSKTKEASKKPKSKSSRCKDIIDWVEVEYGDAYEKPKQSSQSCNQGSQSCNQGSQSCNQSISSTLVKHLTKSEIESLRQNKRDAYALMMKMD